MDKLKSWLFLILPHHFISRFIFLITRIKSPLCRPAIYLFCKAFKVNLSEAEHSRIKEYNSFNAFFTRALKADARPIQGSADTLCSPVDGCFSQLGDIRNGIIIQAKQHDYTCEDLLANVDMAARYLDGSFANIYLSPRDYHRIHMPFDAELLSATYVPGRLFSVSPSIVEHTPRLFARNERVICEFNSSHGYIAIVLVGAINVAAIETIWHGLVTPPNKRHIRFLDTPRTQVKKGQEIARFNMGSTVIMLSQNRTAFSNIHKPGSQIQMGNKLGKIEKPR